MGRDGDAARPELIVRARGLSARFGRRVALDGLDLDVAPGETVGILGPNGAGKTTALRCIRVATPHVRLGIAGDEPIHIDPLTGFENAIGFAMAAGMTRTEAARQVTALLETFALARDAHRPVAGYSLGMRRRLLLLEAFAHGPMLILLDEPTAGLDPDGVAILGAVLRERTAAGACAVIATNDLPAAAALCDRVLFLREGRPVLEGRPAELIARLGGATRYEFTLTGSRAPHVHLDGLDVVHTSAARLVALARDGSDTQHPAPSTQHPEPASLALRGHPGAGLRDRGGRRAAPRPRRRVPQGHGPGDRRVNAAVWWLEWRLAARRPRVFVLSMAVPLALVAALAVGRAPTPHAALVYTVLFTFFGTFGAGIPWARDSERGLIHRLLLTGINPAGAIAQRWLASALLDLVQLLPSMALIAWWYRADGGEALRLVSLVAAGLLAANALGLLVAAIARSLAETALLASVAALLLLHAAGVFRTPEPGSKAAAIERVVPFHYMYDAVRDATGAPR